MLYNSLGTFPFNLLVKKLDKQGHIIPGPYDEAMMQAECMVIVIVLKTPQVYHQVSRLIPAGLPEKMH